MYLKNKNDTFLDFVFDQLGALQELGCRPMFGGHGLSLAGDFFGIVYGGRLYFKTDLSTEEKYKSRGMEPFEPNEKQVLRTYYEVPPDILEDGEALAAWAREAASRRKEGKERVGKASFPIAGGAESFGRKRGKVRLFSG